MNKSDIYLGQTLRLDARGKSRIVQVTKINTKNVKVEDETGTIWNCHPIFLNPARPGDVFAPAPVASHAGGEKIDLGSVVRFKNTAKNKHPLYVVIGSHSGNWRIAALGGDNGRYYRGISTAQLEVVEFNLDMAGA